jgi:hypothetical protein
LVLKKADCSIRRLMVDPDEGVDLRSGVDQAARVEILTRL